jgi:glyoxylase-like metal-dependent hydrolase (beta-lactamase superfamily II)
MRTIVAGLASFLLLSSALAANAQDSKAALEAVAKAMGADITTSVVYVGSGTIHQVGQSPAPGMPWPKFNAKSYSRSINYDTSAMRDDLVRTQGEDPPRGGGNQPIRGEARQTFLLAGDLAWNLVGDVPVPSPIALADRQFQMWSTPHGIVKAALAGKGSMQGRTITVAVPGRFKADATVNEKNLVEKVTGTVPNAVLGDMPVEIVYAEYKDFGGVMFPTKIRQSAGGFPTVDITVTDVQPNMAFDVPVPPLVRQAGNPYTRVTSQMVADGVWFISGGTHNSGLIEMKDYAIVVEAPLNDDRAMAVIMEARNLVPNKPIRYVVATHHHFDHSGGLRAFAAVNVTVIAHESGRAFMERLLSAPATVNLDRLANSGRVGTLETVGTRRVISDGTRTVEIHHVAGQQHAADLLMVYLPKEKVLIEADVYTPLAPNATPPTPPSPYTVAFADHVKKLNLAVDQILPLHGRVVPAAELNKTLGR